MEHIFTRLEEGLTYGKYMDLYTYVSPLSTHNSVIYNFCTHNRMTSDFTHQNLDRQSRGTPSFSIGLELMIGAYLMGQDLYKYLIVYLNDYLKGLRLVS
jgi:hypothetical protein